ncbi:MULTISPECIES: hypothetical protein [Pedobacter]|uniref:hypothetical protein n=1 Tax=Pedobacter TaxID=84567 RepID=UPI001E2A9E97|nr:MULTISPECIES: hypothetical protein [Pedobacter]
MDEKENVYQVYNKIAYWFADNRPKNLIEKSYFDKLKQLIPTGENGESWGMNGGENLFHASLDTEEYLILFKNYSFKILSHTVNDPFCGGATVWLAQFKPQ